MPGRFNFHEIKRQKDRRVALLFFLSSLGYIIAGISVWWITKAYFYYSSNEHVRNLNIGLSIKEVLIVSGIVLAVLFINWMFVLSKMLSSTISRLNGEPPDENDKYHRVFLNIIEELKLASGISNITPYVCMDRAVNAFTISDLKGNIVIGVTEGAVGRLSRQQLEAVIAHEMGHIVAGDSVSASVFVAMMNIYGAVQRAIAGAMKGSIYISGASGYRARHRERDGGGGILLYLVVLLVVLTVLKFINMLLVFVVSREREFRADALAVKVYRNPLALAEALAVIAIESRVSQLSADETLSTLFIAPLSDKVSMFSTHPPLKKRIEVLLGMAHYHGTVEDFLKEVEKKHEIRDKNRVQRSMFVVKEKAEEYFVMQAGKWTGPFQLVDLMTVGLSWDAFVKKGQDGDPKPAVEHPEIKEFVFSSGAQRSISISESNVDKLLRCPKCDVPLKEADYEGTVVYVCGECGGILVGKRSLDKILIRKEQGFSEGIIEEGNRIIKISKNMNRFPKLGRVLVCPRCRIVRPKFAEKSKMFRRLFSTYAPIEIDVCMRCMLYWFDLGELELLQYVMEHWEKEGRLQRV